MQKLAPHNLRRLFRESTAARALYFPLTLVYLELVLHIYMGLDLKYCPVYILFGLSAGCLLEALVMLLSPRAERAVSIILSAVLALIYIVEIIAKSILQAYYPFSALSTAAGNHLSDYASVIASTVLKSFPVIVLLFLPLIFLAVFGKRLFRPARRDDQLIIFMAAGMVVFHLFGLLSLRLPWRGDLTPEQLYNADTNLDDQVEQLGLSTMLRLDIKHMFVPAEALASDDFELFGEPEEYAPALAPVTESRTDSSAPEEGESVMVYEPNITDVDLKALAEGTSDTNIQWLAKYFNSRSPTYKNEYTGIFEGYNVIQFVLEGFSGYAIDPELTPTLYKLANEGFVFSNYYTPLHFTSTSNGECQTLLGLYPKNGTPITMSQTGALGTDCRFCLAQQLGRLGYGVYGYHNNADMYERACSHTNLGYDWRYCGHGLDWEKGGAWPQRDKFMIEQSVDDYINSEEPFHIYYLTVSGHTDYGWHWVASQYKDLVSDLPYSQRAQAYIASAAIEADRAIEYLIERLEEAGKLDNTLIIATGDHIPYADVDILEELTGKKFGSSEAFKAIQESAIDFDVYRNTLIMWSASMEEPVYVDKVCGQVDILPTVSNLLGLVYDSRMLAGSDILSDSEGQVIFSSRSWKTDRGFYDRFTQEFTPAEGVEMTEAEREQYAERMKDSVSNKLASTELILRTNFYNYAFSQSGGNEP